jgi:hypothetical protein
MRESQQSNKTNQTQGDGIEQRSAKRKRENSPQDFCTAVTSTYHTHHHQHSKTPDPKSKKKQTSTTPTSISSVAQLSQRLPTKPLHLLGIKPRSKRPAHSLSPHLLAYIGYFKHTTPHPLLQQLLGLCRKSKAHRRRTSPAFEILDVGQVAAHHADEGCGVGCELVFFWSLWARGDYHVVRGIMVGLSGRHGVSCVVGQSGRRPSFVGLG